MPQKPSGRWSVRALTVASYDFLRSRKLALFLIIALTAALLIAEFVPQASQLSKLQIEAWKSQRPQLFSFLKATGLSSVYNSFWFYALLTLFLLNALLCTVERTQHTFRVWKYWSSNELSVSLLRKISSTQPVPSGRSIEEALNIAEEALTKRRYTIYRGEDCFIARKSGLGHWGPTILHVSFLIIALGVLIGRMTFMTGRVELAEGQGFEDTHRSYPYVQEGPLFNENHEGFVVMLDKFKTEFWGNGANKERASSISIYDNGKLVLSQKISPNYPATYKDRIIFQLNDFGYTAVFEFRKTGGPSNAGAVNFKTPKSDSLPIEERFDVPETDYKATTQFYPDYENRGTKGNWNLYQVKDPALALRVYEKKASKNVYEGLLRPGDSVNLGKGNLAFLEVRRWTRIGVTKDSGAWLVFFGFWMALAGAVMVYCFVPKKIWGLVEEGEGSTAVYLAGTATKYRASFTEQVDDLRREIADALSNEKR